MLGDPKKIAMLVLAGRKAKAGQGTPGDAGSEGLSAAAEELIAAVHSKDSKGVIAALRSAFEQMESEPHKEAGMSEGGEVLEHHRGF